MDRTSQTHVDGFGIDYHCIYCTNCTDHNDHTGYMTLNDFDDERIVQLVSILKNLNFSADHSVGPKVYFLLSSVYISYPFVLNLSVFPYIELAALGIFIVGYDISFGIMTHYFPSSFYSPGTIDQ